MTDPRNTKDAEDFFAVQKPPYILTIVFTSIGWVFTTLLSYTDKYRWIEYETIPNKLETTNNGKYEIDYIIKNISTEKEVDTVSFYFLFHRYNSNNQKCKIASFGLDQTNIMLSEVMAYTMDDSAMLYVQLCHFQPDASITVQLYLKNNIDTPVMRCFSHSQMKCLPKSILTDIQVHKVIIILFFLLIDVELLIIYALYYSSNMHKKANRNKTKFYIWLIAINIFIAYMFVIINTALK